ncbi:hypothetical protein NLG97_g4156 [Lecanicillium saksenae]|uniref:Uncharacterized protein n=1 Tax=Lecanicillium saksenae TaxID=468837 RepID=A0ACC1R004_9HYPO|nr:hypothetical protein NLG97_g4156 [Lecanicillium saksenae]
MAKHISSTQAKDIVQKLGEKWGLPDAAMMKAIEDWKPEYRRALDRTFLSLENAASHSIKTLAKELYGSDARFVFELLQNADDNKFSEATRKAAAPYITFKVYRSKIIVECNEDGFTERDLTAICDVGQSTKATEYGYIGAKGIGFKSVFIAASKVYIQSGNFSFNFEHKKEDPGLGMVRPIWVEPAEELPGPLTRMTLWLHDDEADADDLRKIIVNQLDSLHESCLLFLKNLQCIQVQHYGDDDLLLKTTRFAKEKIDEYRIKLTRNIATAVDDTTTCEIYHVTKQKARDLAESVGRTTSGSATAKDGASSAEVILAFQLNELYEPKCDSRQELFAFLPLCSHDYKFIIQSDFDTTGNRQGIIVTSKRNRELRKWIATAFVTAVLEFCQHPTLCYQWPEFLPNSDENTWDAFWAGLNAEIKQRLAEAEVLESRSLPQLRRIDELRRLPSVFHVNGEPLFNDKGKDIFISSKYPLKSQRILSEYGLKVAYGNEMLNLVEQDMQSQEPRMHSEACLGEWQSAVSLLLASFIEKDWFVDRIRSLPLLPLSNGKWTSANISTVYFPAAEGIPIPPNLELDILSQDACQNHHRKDLFRLLGASEASIGFIQSSIIRLNAKKSEQFYSDIRAHLHFLYRTCCHPSSEMNSAQIFIVASDNRWTSARHNDIYLSSSTDPYSARVLLAEMNPDSDIVVKFTRDIYMLEVPSPPSSDHPTWERWLYDFVGVRERLRLVAPNGNDLSDVLIFVLQHRLEFFLGLLEHVWKHEASQLLANRSWMRKICRIEASDLCQVNYNVTLQNTWLPHKVLKEKVGQYISDDGGRCGFPFLDTVSSDATGQLDPKWGFLSNDFGVGSEDSLNFYLEILKSIERIDDWYNELSLGQFQRIYDLYVVIAMKHAVEKDSVAATKRLKDFFEDSYIFVSDSGDTVKGGLSDFVWRGPAKMRKKPALQPLYKRTVGDKLPFIEQLFYQTLEIPSASLADIIEELKAIRDDDEGAENIMELYKYLDKSGHSVTSLSSAFRSNALIMVESQGQRGWYKTSDTLWSSSAPIRGKVTLDAHYEALESFFVTKIGVKSLTFDMVYDELVHVPQSISMDDITVSLLALSNFLRDESPARDPAPLKGANIFPIKYGNSEPVLRSAETDFAIADRVHLQEHFGGKVALLNFDLEDIHRLRPLLSWLGLESRFLSNSVREIISVSPGSGNIIAASGRDLRRKAYYIVRVAATYGSAKYEDDPAELYQLLRDAETLETDDIHVTLQLSQNGKTTPIEDSSPNIHIDESNSGLKFYLPKKKKVQSIAFSSVLPRKLLWWLKGYPDGRVEDREDVAAISALSLVLSCDVRVLDEILTRQGVLQIDVDNVDELDDDLEDDSEEDNGALTPDAQSQTETLVEETAQSHMRRERVAFSEPPLRSQPRDSSNLGSFSPQRFMQEPSFTPDIFPATQIAHLPPSSMAAGSNGWYRAILERVVNSARVASFPSRGSSGVFNMDSLRGALFNDDGTSSFHGYEVGQAYSSDTQFQRDLKVGAAGELYVFELLSSLHLPGWGRDNWQSRIRTWVNIHPDYTDLQPWNNRETSDFVYDDTAGEFTAHLVDRGYLSSSEWGGACPKYFIEVKSTTSVCGTPFYMSGNQYDLMQSKHQSQDRSEVYMILRVFGLRGLLGMCAYLDPEEMRQNGQLLFTAPTWSIVPA